MGDAPKAARAVRVLAPNFVAIEMPGRTLFEIRQIMRVLCLPAACVCLDELKSTLRELEAAGADNRAHR
jgi:hypothetical protein